MANVKDGATGTVLIAPSPQSSGNTLKLNSGESLRYPLPPFYAVAHPNSQIPVVSISEKILVTAVDTATDIITFTRAVSPYTAKNIDIGWRISNAIFQDDFNNASIVTNEVPAGLVNGANTTFTLASTVHTTGTLAVHRNGIRLKGGGNDFTETALGFSMTTPPATGALLVVDYIIAGAINNVGTNSLITDETPTGAVNGSNKLYTAARPYIPGSLEPYINGMKQKRTVHFVETNPAAGTFTMDDAPLTGDDVMINYAFNLNPAGNTDTVDGIHASATPAANMLYPLDSGSKYPSAVSNLPVVNRNNNGSSAPLSQAKMEIGWAAVTFGTAGSANTMVINFLTTFTDRPIVTLIYGGDQSSGGIAYGSGGNTVHGAVTSKATSITTTGFVAIVHQAAGANWAVGATVYVQYMAVGV